MTISAFTVRLGHETAIGHDVMHELALVRRHRRQGGLGRALVEARDRAVHQCGQLDLPEGTELTLVLPAEDGRRGVCVFRSDSVATVRGIVDGATSAVSKNEFHAVNESGALGLSA